MNERHAPVLVVDDQEVNRRVAELMLGHLGYRSLSVDGGFPALRVLEATRCAAVLMDCRIPDLDGFAATAEVRRREELDGARRTPIIALTADDAAGDRERCLVSGMDDYLAKPVQIEELARALSRWVPATQGQPSLLDADVLARIRDLELPGQTTLLEEMLQAFQATATTQLQRLEHATRSGDVATVIDAAHALKGSAATLGARRVAAMALEWERQTDGACQLSELVAAVDEALEALLGMNR